MTGIKRELCVDCMIKRIAIKADVDMILALFGMSLISEGNRISAMRPNFCCSRHARKAIVMHVSRTTWDRRSQMLF